jgi:hypothetical protein
MLLAMLGVLVIVTMPNLGSDPWPFNPPSVHPRGVLGPLVRAADLEWDLGIIRSMAVLAGLAVALAAAATWRFRVWPRWAGIGLTALVCAMLLVPAVLLQVGLRDATAPWYFTNDSTYEIELAGDLVLDGRNPYGHDYEGSGLEGGADGRRLAARAEPVRRLPHFRLAGFARAVTGRTDLSGSAALATRNWSWAGREPAARPRCVVRNRGRSPSARACARLRTPHPGAFRLGGGEPGRGRFAQAVRARRSPLFRSHALDDACPAPRPLPGRRGVRRSLPRRGVAVPRRRPGSALERHGRLSHEHVPDHRLRASIPASSTNASATTPSCRSRCSSGCRSRAGSCGINGGPRRSGPGPPGLLSRCSCCFSWAACCRTRSSFGL